MSGSKGARASPDLIAACHVFHRLSTPRHPSEALMRLIVLSKTHAWGRFVIQPYERPENAHTCALCFDVFSGQSSKLQGKPDKPFNSQCHSPTWLKARLETCHPRSLATSIRPAKPKPARAGEGWWSQTGSNRRPHACKARALPTELWPLVKPAPLGTPRLALSPKDHTAKCGGPRQTRTADLTLIRRVL